MNIYLDTNLWNELCDQCVDASRLITSLDARNAGLVLSHHAVYELARCFLSPVKTGPERGRVLFSYLSVFTRRNIRCTNEVLGVLSAEMCALRRQEPVNPFLSSETYGELSHEVEKLAVGEFDGKVRAFVEELTALAMRVRSGPVAALARRPDVKRRLERIPEQQLGAWLETETITDRGVDQLAAKVMDLCEISSVDAAEWALGLLESPMCLLSKALVRADLYYSWRCANRGSNPRDLFDDMYHVLNGIYCDVYATKEPGHARYAGLLLTRNTKIAIYDGQAPLGQWIEALS